MWLRFREGVRFARLAVEFGRVLTEWAQFAIK
jgi:hypothetical protein